MKRLFNSSIDLYFLRAIATPLWTTLVVAVMLLVLEQMLRLFDFVLNENGPAGLVWQMLLYLLPEYLGLAMPLGLFLGILLAIRRLSISSELDAMTAGGISLWRLLRPTYTLSIALMLVNFLLVAYLEPHSHYRYAQTKFEVRSGALGAKIQAGEFVKVADDMTLRVDGFQDGGETLVNPFLERCNARGVCIAVTASRGEFAGADTEDEILLRLFDGRQVELGPQFERPRIVRFDRQAIPIHLPEIQSFRARGGDKEEATFAELLRVVRSETTETFEQFPQYNGSLHWRLIHTLTFLALPLLAVPMGIAAKRNDSGVGPVVGVATLIIYNELVEAAESRVSAGLASPWIAMWPLLLGFTVLGFVLFYAVAERPGGRAAGPLEAAISGVKWLTQSTVRVLKGART